MELKDRVATHPGRVVLRNVATGVETTYDIIVADGATEQGTPINSQTLLAFKEEILDAVKGLIPEPTTPTAPSNPATVTNITIPAKGNDIY